MDLLKRYILPRLVQWLIVILIGVTVVFLVPRLMPMDPVQSTISQMNNYNQLNPEAIKDLKDTLADLYGLKGSLLQQYYSFWSRLINFDLGPSLSMFPTPVIKVILTSLPWTVGLVVVSLIISWLLGIILGTISGFFPNNILVQILDKFIIILYPVPYYIMAMLLLLLFAYIYPIFPLMGGAGIGLKPALSIEFISSIIKHAFLPAVSLILIGIGFRYIVQKALVSTLISSDFVEYAQSASLSKKKIIFKYILRNSLLPQVTDLGLSLGGIFGGALITEIVFSYPGIGQILYNSIMSGDYNMIMGITIFSVVGIATAALIIDLIYPLLDPRIRYK